MKLRKRIACWLYPKILKYERFNDVDLTRLNLNLMPVKDVEDIDRSTEYLGNAHILLGNEMLQNEMDLIVKEQSDAILAHEPSAIGLTKVETDYLARGTINGIALLKERLEQNRNLYDEIDKKI